MKKEEVIARAIDVFRRKGFHSASMSDVGAACGLLKGSLYHHFESKEALALAVIDNLHGQFRREVFSISFTGAGGPGERMRSMATKIERYFGGCDNCCLMGILSLELGGEVPGFSDRL
ncbi:MAG: TetR/AcrR family transcriptional regulator, partial [Alphaproteobacteria bacterium]|nr:TetR/AcrR family transcriptional regulator [Alphaproteobacteria bacterium]